MPDSSTDWSRIRKKMEIFLGGEEIIQGIAVQIGWYSWRMRLILLAYWAAQNQVHRKATEIAEGCFLLRPIVRGDWIANLMPLIID